MVRLAAYGGLSCLLAGYVVLSSFRQRSNFFSAAVYLSKSNACMMILWNFGVFLTILFGRALQSIFFGPLRLIEIERLHERAWYAVTESLLALTIFREEFDTSFVVLFTSLLFLKVFHWLAADRVEMMDSSPSIPRIFHLRMVTVLSTLWIIDACLIVFATDSILLDGPSVMIMFASEYMIMLATLLGTTLKYAVSVHDLRRGEENGAWENKSVYIFYIDLACDFLKLATYLCFFSLILTFYGLPLNILRDVYITARSFAVRVRDLIRYRRATKNMNERYPNATAEELERMSDKTCIICREEMEARAPNVPAQGGPPGNNANTAAPAPAPARTGPNDTPKKLPCGHIFHFHCLRSWLERQQSCPTCRRPVLTDTAASASQQQQAAQRGPIVPGQGGVPAPPQPGQIPRPSGLTQPQPTPTAGTPSGATAGPHQQASPPNDAQNQVAARLARSQQHLQQQLRSHLGPNAANQPLNHLFRPVTPVPLAGQAAPEHSSRRRGAGLDNPLVAFGMAFQATKPTQTATTSTSPQQQAVSSNTGSASTTVPAPASAAPAVPRPIPSVTVDSDQTDNATSAPLATTSSSNSATADGEDRAARRQKMMAAARARMAPVVAASSSRSGPPSPLPSAKTLADLAPLPGYRPASPPPPRPTLAPNTDFSQAPRLIPLFDPSNPSAASSYARFFPSLARANLLPDIPGAGFGRAAASVEPLQNPDNLTQDQLATLGEITREGLEGRLKLLSNTQETISACMRQMQAAMQVLDGGDLQSALRVVEELNAANAPSQDKGKGRAVESQASSA